MEEQSKKVTTTRCAYNHRQLMGRSRGSSVEDLPERGNMGASKSTGGGGESGNRGHTAGDTRIHPGMEDG